MVLCRDQRSAGMNDACHNRLSDLNDIASCSAYSQVAENIPNVMAVRFEESANPGIAVGSSDLEHEVGDATR